MSQPPIFAPTIDTCIHIQSFDAYDDEKRTAWIVSGLWPGQIVLAVTQTMWTFQCEAAITQGGPRALRAYVGTMNTQLRYGYSSNRWATAIQSVLQQQSFASSSSATQECFLELQ